MDDKETLIAELKGKLEGMADDDPRKGIYQEQLDRLSLIGNGKLCAVDDPTCESCQ